MTVNNIYLHDRVFENFSLIQIVHRTIIVAHKPTTFTKHRVWQLWVGRIKIQELFFLNHILANGQVEFSRMSLCLFWRFSLKISSEPDIYIPCAGRAPPPPSGDVQGGISNFFFVNLWIPIDSWFVIREFTKSRSYGTLYKPSIPLFFVNIPSQSHRQPTLTILHNVIAHCQIPNR